MATKKTQKNDDLSLEAPGNEAELDQAIDDLRGVLKQDAEGEPSGDRCFRRHRYRSVGLSAISETKAQPRHPSADGDFAVLRISVIPASRRRSANRRRSEARSPRISN